MGQGKQANTTVIWAASATGQIIPPYIIIFKGKLNFYKNSTSGLKELHLALCTLFEKKRVELKLRQGG